MNSGGWGLSKGLLVGLVSTDLTIGVLMWVMRTISCSEQPWVWSSRMRLMVCAVGMGCPFQLSCLFAAQVRMMQKMRLAVRKSRSPVFNVRVSLIVVGVVRVWGRVGMGSVG